MAISSLNDNVSYHMQFDRDPPSVNDCDYNCADQVKMLALSVIEMAQKEIPRHGNQ